MPPSAAEILGPSGPFRRMAGYEDRPGQAQMAGAVEDALARGRVLLCEAGTGTGKTLAYLVPALLSSQRIVISTATKTLQDQILTKDIPLVAEHLGVEPEVALVKGLGNYLCLRRFDEMRKSPAGGLRSLPLIETWASETQTGDVAELVGLAEGDPTWREVASSSETRIGSSCPHYEACFVTGMRRDADRAQIVIANHHLFFADLALKAAAGERGFAAGALPPYDAVILDEAHQIEDIATQFFGVGVSRARVETMLRDADRAFFGAGLTDPVFGRGDGTALTELVREASEVFFATVLQAANAGSGEGRQLLGPGSWNEATSDAWGRFDELLETLAAYAHANATNEAVRLVVQRVGAVRAAAAKVLDPSKNQVAWIDVTQRNVSIGASPVDLGDTLRAILFERAFATVLTSATLTTASGRPAALSADAEGGGVTPFSFIRSRLGLEGDVPFPVDELTVPSPFDFAESALLYVPTDLPEPSAETFFAEASERASELIALTGGGAFVLCTSVRAMRAIAKRLGALMKRTPMVQGDAPKNALLSRFRSKGDAVLVATMSFWEGVDVPGDALRLVVIDKIPFAVPNEPVVAARAKAIEAAGGSPFLSYFVPNAAITLKQGFGRLIRTGNDHGIVAVLDRRVRTKGYGRALIESLPPARRASSLEEVRAWWTARTTRPQRREPSDRSS